MKTPFQTNPLIAPPRLNRTSNSHDRKVTWLELFYDLVYVATLIQLGNTLSEDISLTGFLRFAVLFAPIWWAWTGITFYTNRFIADDLWHRGLILLQIVAIFFLAISVDGAFGDLTSQFAWSYAAIRFIQVLLYIRTWRHEPATKPLTQRYVTSYLVGISLWVVSAFLTMPYAVWLWLAALLIEIGMAVSRRTRSLVSLLPPDVHHMRERYGIFVIIVLGESFIKTITAFAGTPITFLTLVFSLLSILVVFGLWWLYFSNLEGSIIKDRIWAPFMWVYAHLPLAMGITAFGVASKKLFQAVGEDHIKSNYLILFCTALILYTLAMALIEAALSHEEKPLNSKLRLLSRGGMVMALIFLVLIGGSIGSITLMGIVATGCAALILIDEIPHLRKAPLPVEERNKV